MPASGSPLPEELDDDELDDDELDDDELDDDELLLEEDELLELDDDTVTQEVPPEHIRPELQVPFP